MGKKLTIQLNCDILIQPIRQQRTEVHPKLLPEQINDKNLIQSQRILCSKANRNV